MATIVELNGCRATFAEDGYRWESEQPTLADTLNSLLDPRGPSGADPNPSATAAVEAQRVFGITFIELDETDPEVDGCVN